MNGYIISGILYSRACNRESKKFIVGIGLRQVSTFTFDFHDQLYKIMKNILIKLRMQF